MINVFIIGSKGIPARYGGFETFVENLTKRKNDRNIHYFVSCMGDKGTFIYNDATCFSIPSRFPGPVGRIFQVSKALDWTLRYIKKNTSSDKNIVYILGCRIGLVLKRHVISLHRVGCKVVCNPDGLEWKRGKWNKIEKKILKLSEKKLVLDCDFIICDSIGIQDYILSEYREIPKRKTAFIAYGCDFENSNIDEESFHNWETKNSISKNGFYLVVCRFVPENNIELIIREFMASKTEKDLVLITNVQKNKFYLRLKKKLNFAKDDRIKFVGTVYDSELLKKIRKKCFAYIHGHSVGGTNPSLLEAMGQSSVNILFDVPFNREVGGDQVVYFNSKAGSLLSIINSIESKTPSFDSKSIIVKRYSWDLIVSKYEFFFENEL